MLRYFARRSAAIKFVHSSNIGDSLNHVSLLIGSGFSVPAEYPTTTKLNERLCRIGASEICVHTDREAWFLNGQPDPNAERMGVEERRLVQELLEFYNTQVLRQGEGFHYETFYDYYITPYLTNSYPDELLDFLTGFKRQHKAISDIHHLLMTFNDIFTQLLSQLLTKPIERVHYCKPYHPNYNAFLLLLENLSTGHKVHIHTLNHDIYLESLSLTDSIQDHFADGFEELGSRIYAKKYEKYASYMVRLRRFTNKYDEPFCLYKLHGSVDNYWVSFEDGTDLVKLPWGVSPHEIHKEVLRNGQPQYSHSPADVVADFLSGTTHKIDRYENGSYYPVLFRHFQTNLKQSKTLVVIGYGFGDIRINRYLEECFLYDSSKEMFIVDLVRPSTPLLGRSNVHFIEGGVSGMDYELIAKRTMAPQ